MSIITCGYDISGSSLDYTTIASSIIAAAPYDEIQTQYSSAIQGVLFNETVSITTTPVSVTNMLSQIVGVSIFSVSATITSDITITGYHAIHGSSASTMVIGAGSSADLFIDRCSFNNTVLGNNSGSAGEVYFRSCNAEYTFSNGFTGNGGADCVFINCTAIGCRFRGFRFGTAYNCLAIGNDSGDFNSMSGGDYNISSDGTAPGGNSSTKELSDLALYGLTQGRFRPSLDSFVCGAGNATTEQPVTDYYGVTFASPPSIGAFECALLENTPSNVLISVTGGTFDEAARNTDPGIANVSAPTSYLIQNVAKVGTFDEDARNTDPGQSNVLRGISYIIRGITKLGTFDSSLPASTGNIMEDGASWLKSKLFGSASSTVIYRRGSDELSGLNIVRAETTAELRRDFGLNVDVRIADFLIREEDLIIPPSLMRTKPQRGDEIVFISSDETVTYEVLSEGQEDVYRESDRFGNLFRVHTKETGRT